MNRSRQSKLWNLTAFALSALAFGGCASIPGGPPAVAEKAPKVVETVAVVKPPVCEPRFRKPTAANAPFLVEAFRCTMQPSPNLHVGIRVYSSLDGKETTLIYGPERMDSPPVANDSVLYNGVTVVLAGADGGKTQYSFQHAKLSLQINVPRSAPETAVFDAIYSDDTGATGIKGVCTWVTPVTY
jgi:hypothetical protein